MTKSLVAILQTEVFRKTFLMRKWFGAFSCYICIFCCFQRHNWL